MTRAPDGAPPRAPMPSDDAPPNDGWRVVLLDPATVPPLRGHARAARVFAVGLVTRHARVVILTARPAVAS